MVIVGRELSHPDCSDPVMIIGCLGTSRGKERLFCYVPSPSLIIIQFFYFYDRDLGVFFTLKYLNFHLSGVNSSDRVYLPTHSLSTHVSSIGKCFYFQDHRDMYQFRSSRYQLSRYLGYFGKQIQFKSVLIHFKNKNISILSESMRFMCAF
jgi:hypothetical protein